MTTGAVSQTAVISDAARVHLRWALCDGIGPNIFARVMADFGDAAAALEAGHELTRIRGISRERAAAILRGPGDSAIEAEISAAAEHGVRIICRADAEFPQPLLRIPDPPIVLYIKGALRATDAVALAIVGSRRCTIYGSEQARRFGELLAGAGFTVVSGLARGIDAFAHHGCVDAGGRTIAVLGNGLTDIYPPENRALAEKLLVNGAWVSELPMRASVRRENFDGRNRIIAGLSLGTLVIEAAARSGALITARHATEYNREVFAIPGRVQDPMSIGTNALIRDGAAKLVTGLEDVLDALGYVGDALRAEPTKAKESLFAEPRPEPTSVTDAERRILDVLTEEPVLQDEVLSHAGLPAGEALAAITSLELRGALRRLPGARIVRR